MSVLESVPSYSDYFCGFGGSSQGARKLGRNAVTPCASSLLLGRVVEALTGEAAA